MKLIFAGTPVFAEHALSRLIDQGFEIALVLTQPDRPAGRGMKLIPSQVKQLALAHQLEVFQPQSLRQSEVQTKLESIAADVMIVAAYGLIIPASILALPKYGCINIHASLLPRWRGAAPIQRALLAGDAVSGITIMQMDEGLDTGAILMQQSIPIHNQETAATLHDKLAQLGSELIVDALKKIASQSIAAVPQPKDGATYAAKINKEEAMINWSQSNIEVDRLIRAFNPVPGAVTNYQSAPVKIWQAQLATGKKAKPGEITEISSKGITVACGTGSICLEALQRAGGKKISAQAFCSGSNLQVGEIFGDNI
jgi:methionyl-tRNA formyltransferase